MKKNGPEIERVDVPANVADLAARRTQAIIQSAVMFPDALNVIARSCYLQGFEDAANALLDGKAAQGA